MSYSYSKFLRPLSETDVNIQILDNNGKITYTINPFSILHVEAPSNVLKINMKSGKIVHIPFSTSNESKIAIVRLQKEIEKLKAKKPLYIDKSIQNYVESELGTSGMSGTSGTSGFGTSGISGTDGTSGTSGAQGIPGETLTPLGVVLDYPSLTQSHGTKYTIPPPNLLDTYITVTGSLWIYDDTSIAANSEGWVDMGAIAGPKGLDGTSGLDGTKLLGTSSTPLQIPQVGYYVSLDTQPNLGFTPMQTVLVYNGLYDNYMVDDYIEDDSAIYFTGQIDYYDTQYGILDLVVDYQQGYGLTNNNGDVATYSNWYISLIGKNGSDLNILNGLTLSNTLQFNGNQNDFLGLGFDNYLVTSSVFDVVSDFVSLDSTDTMQILADGDLTISSGTQLTLVADSGLIAIGNTQGLVYSGDYSSGFVNRSLVDKGYVDSLVGSVGATNGLTEISANVVSLGGTLSQNTNIDVDSYTFSVTKNSFGLSISESQVSFGDSSKILITSTNSIVSDTSDDNYMIVNDSTGKGLVYDDDYSSNFTDNSLVNKGYVDTAISSIPLSVGLTNSIQLKYGNGFIDFGFKNNDSLLINKQYVSEPNALAVSNTFIGINSGNNNTTGQYNTFIGRSSGYSNTSGYFNVFIGAYSGCSNKVGINNVYIGRNVGQCGTQSNYNTFIGDSAGYYNIGNSNTFIGSNSGYFNECGDSNTFLGFYSGYNNKTGGYNTHVGNYSGYNSCGANYNTLLGFFSGFSNQASSNTFIGTYTGYNNSTGDCNTFIGFYSGNCNTSGSINTFIGAYSGHLSKEGNKNVFIGYNTGFNNASGCNNTFVGFSSGYCNTTGLNNTFIGDCSACSVTTGNCNTIIGSNTGNGLTTGNYNTIVGANVTVSATTASNIILADGQGNIKYHFDGTTTNINGGLVSLDHTVLAEVSEVINTSFGATAATVTYNFNDGLIWYHGTASQNYTANFINLPTTNDRVITANILINQGSTGYSPTQVQIGGVTQTIKWSGGTYSVSTNAVDIIGLTFIRSSSNWTQVLGQISSFS